MDLLGLLEVLVPIELAADTAEEVVSVAVLQATTVPKKRAVKADDLLG